MTLNPRTEEGFKQYCDASGVHDSGHMIVDGAAVDLRKHIGTANNGIRTRIRGCR
jgi:hypothetical protein